MVSSAAGALTTAIDVSDADIATALAIGANDVTVGGVTISSAEFAVLDGAIDLSGAEATGVLAAGRFPALTGDVTTVAGALATTIADNSIDGTDIALGSDAQGDIMYYDGTDWARLGVGTSGQFLKTQGAAANPVWASAPASTLQADYDATSGNIITTTDARDVDLVLANTTTDSNLDIDISTGSTSTVSISRADGAGAADPTQLLLVENLDTDRAQPTGILFNAAAGGLTTAIDATDAEIGTALSVGANDIVGTTGLINYTNFDVDASGAITAATGITSTGVIDFGGATSTEMVNSTAPSVTADGQFALETDQDQIKIQAGSNVTGKIPSNTDVVIPLIFQKDITLLEPDVIQTVSDAIPIFTVDSYNYPDGIQITAIRLATSASSSASYNIEEWISPTDGTPATIDAIATSASSETTETTITDGAVAAGGYVFVDLDTTDIAWAKITIWYYVKDA